MMRPFERFLESARPEDAGANYERHPSDHLLEAFVHDQLDAVSTARVSAHCATCSPCRERVLELRAQRDRVEAPLSTWLDAVDLAGGAAGRREASRRWWSWLFDDSRPLRYVVAFAGAAAAVLVGVQLTLDRLLVPPVNPLASPEPVDRWWLYLYWLLLPALLLLVWRIYRRIRRRSWRKEE